MKAVAIAHQTARFGSILVQDVLSHSGPFFALEATEGDAVVAACPGNTEWLAGRTIKEDFVRYGHFESVQLSSGKVIAYYATGTAQ